MATAEEPNLAEVSEPGSEIDFDDQVASARQDLAERLEKHADEIEIERVSAVHWSSGAAGCPEPGMSYTMSLVPGVLILLRADGEIYRYHARRNTTPVFCPADRAEAPVLGQGEEVM